MKVLNRNFIDIIEEYGISLENIEDISDDYLQIRAYNDSGNLILFGRIYRCGCIAFDTICEDDCSNWGEYGQTCCKHKGQDWFKSAS